ncbi:MAG: hypothetical protein OEY14_15950 [Myxococcales bacterium]|nr:hypothetical protein [Myxococcales bacterium]
MHHRPLRALILTAILAALLGACASETVDGASAGLMRIDEAEYTDQIFYLDTRISPAPMRAEELGDLSGAIAVGVRFHEGFAVAWAAPNGRVRVGDRESVVAAWRLYESISDGAAQGATLTAGDLDALASEGSTAETETESATFAPIPVSSDLIPILEADLQGGQPSIHFVDWLEENSIEFINFWTSHPGCLE